MPRFSKQSKDNLIGVHPDLVAVAYAAIERVDFSITEGVRLIARQRELVKDGKSWTMNSMHLVQADGYARAFDFIPYPFKSWDDLMSFANVIMVLGEEASRLGVPLRFGANWTKTRDFPHVEMPL